MAVYSTGRRNIFFPQRWGRQAGAKEGEGDEGPSPCGCVRGSVSVRVTEIYRRGERASSQQGPGEVPSRAGEGEAERRSVAEPFF